MTMRDPTPDYRLREPIYIDATSYYRRQLSDVDLIKMVVDFHCDCFLPLLRDIICCCCRRCTSHSNLKATYYILK